MGIDSGLTGADLVWVITGAALVFFMQAGFAIVEAGLTRAKNTGNIIMKNLMDFCLGTIVFWVLGYSLMHGDDIAGIIGLPTTGFITGNIDMTSLIFQTVFCATAATIVSGAMAERSKFSSYSIYSVIISMIVFPISGLWIWGGGWLSQLGFHDFAGSTAVHMVGGISALIGAKIIGPRIGKYDKDGKPKAIPGHNLTFAALGVFILWFCWFGFNGASTYGVTGQEGILSLIFLTTNMAPAAAAVTCLIITWRKYKKPDVSMTFNGALAGLVAITAGTETVSPMAALIIGVISGFVVVYGCEFLEKKAKIDDPVGAIAVHGFNGALGTVMVGIFSFNEGIVGAFKGNTSFADAFRFLSIQVLGVAAVALWVIITMTALFLIIKKTVGLRVSKEEEIGGLDFSEHNLATAYSGFLLNNELDIDKLNVIEYHPSETTPAQMKHVSGKAVNDKMQPKMTLVSIILKKPKFEALKYALNKIGVTGMTVTEVMGCGMQNGHTETYRGAPLDITLVPKLKVDVVISAVPVEKVIEAAKTVLNTGALGDGKIFISDIEDVVKIRTGERGFDALQDKYCQ